MKKIWICIMLTSLSLSSCIKVAPGPTTEAPPLFVTSTLPPTRPGLSLLTATPLTAAPDGSATTTPATPSGTESSGTPSTGACKDSAVMIEDVTVPANTVMQKGQTFTKTWRFMNNGKCNWNGYAI